MGAIVHHYVYIYKYHSTPRDKEMRIVSYVDGLGRSWALVGLVSDGVGVMLASVLLHVWNFF